MTKQQYYEILNRDIENPIKNNSQNNLKLFQAENPPQKKQIATGWYNQLPEVQHAR